MDNIHETLVAFVAPINDTLAPSPADYLTSCLKLFGDNPTGWRIATALVGSLMILLIGLIAQRLFRNSLLTGLASALAALDGLALVLILLTTFLMPICLLAEPEMAIPFLLIESLLASAQQNIKSSAHIDLCRNVLKNLKRIER
jgi:hypothetical protein